MTLSNSVQSDNSFLSFLQSISPFGKIKTHDFRKYQEDVDYCVDFANFYNSAHLTTGISVREGEHIILTDRNQTLKYCAETVEFYWNSDRLREIRLKLILEEAQE